MKQILILILLITIAEVAFTQTIQPMDEEVEPSSNFIETIKQGDIIPDFEFSNLLYSDRERLKMSDFRGKVLLLDFWATWCAPCVASFPKLDSLEKVFDGEFVVLPVTYEDVEKVSRLFERKESLKEVKKEMLVGDDILRSLFPHTLLPHYVWIDQDGKYLGSTGMSEINHAFIEDIISGNKHDIGVVAKRQKLNDEESLFSGNDHIQGKQLNFQSSFGSFNRNISGMYKFYDTNEGGRRLTMANLSLPWIYKVAFSDIGGNLTLGQISIEVSDKSKTNYIEELHGSIEDWMKENTYCYELIVSEEYKSKLYELMRKDLLKIFPQYHAYVEDRESDVFFLEKTGDPIPYGEKVEQSVFIGSFTGFTMENRYLNSLILALNLKWLQHLKSPVIDQTGIELPLTMQLDVNASDPADIDRGLRVHGLSLTKGRQSIPFLVIKDSKETKKENQ